MLAGYVTLRPGRGRGLPCCALPWCRLGRGHGVSSRECCCCFLEFVSATFAATPPSLPLRSRAVLFLRVFRPGRFVLAFVAQEVDVEVEVEVAVVEEEEVVWLFVVVSEAFSAGRFV